MESFFFFLSTQVGELYRLDVFVAERFKCDSNLLLQASGTQFVRQWKGTLPPDHMADISENLHIGALVQVRSGGTDTEINIENLSSSDLHKQM